MASLFRNTSSTQKSRNFCLTRRKSSEYLPARWRRGTCSPLRAATTTGRPARSRYRLRIRASASSAPASSARSTRGRRGWPAPTWPAWRRRRPSARARRPCAWAPSAPTPAPPTSSRPTTSRSSTSARPTRRTPSSRRRALEHGKHVVCEKPLAVSSGEADGLVRALASVRPRRHGPVRLPVPPGRARGPRTRALRLARPRPPDHRRLPAGLAGLRRGRQLAGRCRPGRAVACLC